MVADKEGPGPSCSWSSSGASRWLMIEYVWGTEIRASVDLNRSLAVYLVSTDRDGVTFSLTNVSQKNKLVHITIVIPRWYPWQCQHVCSCRIVSAGKTCSCVLLLVSAGVSSSVCFHFILLPFLFTQWTNQSTCFCLNSYTRRCRSSAFKLHTESCDLLKWKVWILEGLSYFPPSSSASKDVKSKRCKIIQRCKI